MAQGGRQLRVLITGGAGFIGSNLARGCLEAGAEVRVLDNFATGRHENLDEIRRDVEVIEGSIVEPDAVGRASRDCEVIYHQAALPSVPRSVEEPLQTHAVNATGTLNVLQAARERGVRRVVYAASSSAYGDTEVLPKVETMAPNPLSPYALQKYMGEVYCRQFTRLYGLETVALRYFNVFGPRQDPNSAYAAVIPNFITAISKGEPPEVHGDGLQSRDFTFVRDVVAANLAAAAGPAESAGEVFNIACGHRATLLELIDMIAEVLGVAAVEPRFGPPRPGDVRHSQADIGKAEQLLGWRSRHAMVDGLRETVSHLLGRPGK
jgi:UDP-glucose 4-epimerase